MTSDRIDTEAVLPAFQQPELLEKAMTHKSYAHEHRAQNLGNNERLEFLGDSILSAVLTEALILKFEALPEGPLSRLRASLVNEAALAELALKIGLQKKLRLGKGEIGKQGRSNPRLLASALEALIGAYFLDQGFDHARRFCLGLFDSLLSEITEESDFTSDYKTRLQEVIQRDTGYTPEYRVLKVEGPDHSKTFEVELVVNGEVIATGKGPSKKQASQKAAKRAMESQNV